MMSKQAPQAAIAVLDTVNLTGSCSFIRGRICVSLSNEAESPTDGWANDHQATNKQGVVLSTVDSRRKQDAERQVKAAVNCKIVWVSTPDCGVPSRAYPQQ